MVKMKVFLKTVVVLLILFGNCHQTVATDGTFNANEVKTAVESRDVRIVFLSAKKDGVNIPGPENVDSFFLWLKDQIPKDGKVTFVLFSETFFSSDPLDTDRVQSVIDKIKKLSENHPRTFFIVNFLHRFENSNRPVWLPDTGISTPNQSTDLITSDCYPASIVSMFWPNPMKGLRVANYSLLIWNKECIAFYRKSTYFRECENLCVADGNSAGSHTYEFGDWVSHTTTVENSGERKMYNVLFEGNNPLVMMRICSDVGVQAPEGTKKLSKREYVSFWLIMRRGILV
ncbi:MAG: hypothetical protein LBB21_06895 [Holosporaceae bacterium]|jgi:hypothetical protein|nr:hypothetical protein [Holosporaceae bacterium]